MVKDSSFGPKAALRGVKILLGYSCLYSSSLKRPLSFSRRTVSSLHTKELQLSTFGLRPWSSQSPVLSWDG